MPDLPDFKEEAQMAYNAATGDGEPLKSLEEHLRAIFAEGMRYAVRNEDLCADTWDLMTAVRKTADQIEKDEP